MKRQDRKGLDLNNMGRLRDRGRLPPPGNFYCAGIQQIILLGTRPKITSLDAGDRPGFQKYIDIPDVGTILAGGSKCISESSPL